MIIPSLALLASLTLAQAPSDGPAKPIADAFKPDPAWKPLGTSLWFDPKGRRLVVRARVVFREGPLEHLLCLKGTKEHESILASPAVPKLMHAGLLLTGAEVGHPVKFVPKFEPPAGTAIAIDLEWEQDGKMSRADARDWIFDERKNAPLRIDWVFAGSELINDPSTKQPYYAADDGDVITVANFISAMLDLPFASNASDADRTFIARTEKIPPLGTGVTMYLHPRKAAPKSPKP